jgi:sodium/potassium-transporting ATPase subunit alpha
MVVRKVWFDDTSIDANSVTKASVPEVLRIAGICNNARFLDGQYKGDPTEVALLQFVRNIIGDIGAERVDEIPFDSERKRMTTIGRNQASSLTDDRFVAYSKGALESILPLCTHMRVEGDTIPLTEDLRKHIALSSHSLMDTGLRVLSFAYKNIKGSYSAETIESDMVFAGLIGLEDPPRPEVPEAIGKCRQAGIRVIMLTGDGSRTAVAIAREIGLVKDAPTIVEGHVFSQMSDEELRSRLAEKEIVFARMTPKHKMRVVSILKEEGEIVAVTGDGVNDAPALKKADIGVSMGITGTDVAKEASDMVLLDDNFATIVNAVEEGRAVFENIKKFLTYIFASNIPEAVPYLAYILFKIPLPLTIIQILAVDLGTDMLPALALGAEVPTPDVMNRPPRKVKERLLNFRLMSRAYLFLGPMEALASMFGFFYVLYGGGWIRGAMLPPHHLLYLQATTACLTAIIITQIGNVFACRSDRESVISIGVFSNRLIFIGILLSIVLQVFIVYHPIGNKVFGTAPLGLDVWLVLLPFSAFLLFAEEMRKAITRRYRFKQSMINQ